MVEDVKRVEPILVHTVASSQLGQETFQQAGLVEPLDRDRRTRLLQDPVELLPDTLRGDMVEHLRTSDDCSVGLLFDRKSELSCNPYAAKKTESILAEAFLRTPDTADETILQILPTTVGIDQTPLAKAECERVDREITPRKVLLQGSGERDLVGMPRIAVEPVLAKRRDLVGGVLLENEDRPEADPYFDRSWKQSSDPLRDEIGRQIPILGRASEKEIPDASPHKARTPPGFLDSPGNPQNDFGNPIHNRTLML
jgi:hypothetical protein